MLAIDSMKGWTKLVEELDSDVESPVDKEELTEAWSYDPLYTITDSLETIGDVLRNLVYLNKNENRIQAEIWFCHSQLFELMGKLKTVNLSDRFGFMTDKITDRIKKLDNHALILSKEVHSLSPKSKTELEQYLHEIDGFITMLHELPESKKNSYVHEGANPRHTESQHQQMIDDVFYCICSNNGEWMDNNISGHADIDKLKYVIDEVVGASHIDDVDEMAQTVIIAFQNMTVKINEDFDGLPLEADPIQGLADALDSEKDENKSYYDIIRAYLISKKMDIVPLNGIVDKMGEI